MSAIKIDRNLDLIKLNLYLSDNSINTVTIDDFRTPDAKYAKTNIKMPGRTYVEYVFDTSIERIDKNSISHPIVEKEPKPVKEAVEGEEKPEVEVESSNESKEEKSFEQISIFDLDDSE